MAVFQKIVLALAVAAAYPALAQEAARDVGDPSITKKPVLDFDNSIEPEYPAAARRKGESGSVKLRTCVDATGKPYDASVMQSSGHVMLDEASLDWLSNFTRFKPAEAAGTPVAVCNHAFTYEWRAPVNNAAASRIFSYLDASEMRAEDMPVAISRPPPPPYPPGALARRHSGTVRYELCIGPDGAVEEVHMLDVDADMELALAGTYWFGSTKYKPGMKDGKPVGVCGIEAEYVWRLPQPPKSTL